MTSPHSFYLAPEAWREPFVLEGSEAHHLVRVLRIRTGAMVRLFDGKGRFGLFSVLGTGKNRAELRPLEEHQAPPPAVRRTLAAGFSKALRRGWFLEKAVELEAAGLWFWQGDYSQASLPLDRDWTGQLIAGAKQCENPWLPELKLLPGGVEDLAARRAEFDRAFLLYEGDTHGRMLRAEELAAPGSLLLVVGPEGGFSPREVEILMNANITPVSLGDRILRWETAAVLALGLAWWAGKQSAFPREERYADGK